MRTAAKPDCRVRVIKRQVKARSASRDRTAAMVTNVRNSVTAAIMAAAAGLAVPSPAVAQAASRTFKRADLPASFRKSAEEGRLTRVARGRVDTVGADAAVTVTAGQVLATRTGDTAVLVEAPPRPGPGPASERIDSLYRLPFEYLGFEHAAATTTTYRPTYIPEKRLQYSAQDDRFAGSFLIGLQETANPSAESELTAAVRLRLASDADSMVPDTVALQRTNSQYERVRVVARNARDSLRVRIVPAFDPAGVSVWLAVEPALAFEQTPVPIQGLGVESATLVIGTRGSSLPDSVVVTVSANRGGLSTNRLVLRSGGGTVKLRSAGVGTAAVSASAPGFQTANTTVGFKPPVLFLIAAFAGAMLGSIVGTLHAGRRQSATSMVRHTIRGLLVGLFTSAIYIGVGLNLLQFEVDFEFFNEIAVFALAALGGAFGAPALSALRDRLSG